MCITTDNASANNAMMTQLAEMVPYFARQLAHSRCFSHITNLVAKSLIRQFDTGKNEQETGEAGQVVDDMDETMIDDAIANDEAVADNEAAADELDWIDELAELDLEELACLKQSIRPICQMLSKVRLMHWLSDL